MSELRPTRRGATAAYPVANREAWSCSRPSRRNRRSDVDGARTVHLHRYRQSVGNHCPSSVRGAEGYRKLTGTINNENHYYYDWYRCQPRFLGGAGATYFRLGPCLGAVRVRTASRCSATAHSVKANSETPEAPPFPDSTSTGTRRSRLPLRRRARGWPPRGCERVRHAGIVYAR